MKKQVLCIIFALCLMLVLAPVKFFAAPSDMETVFIDVGGEDTENENYKISGNLIILRKRDVVYVLSGSTDKTIGLWGSNNSADVEQAFWLKLDNVTVSGGISVKNSPVRLNIEVPENTVNTLEKVRAENITIHGKGTLNTKDLSVIQQTSYMPNALHITDTNIVVNLLSRNCEWNGDCILSGSACVRITGTGNSAPLQIGVKSGITHSLRLEDSSRLYCLQPDPDTEMSYVVDGIDMWSGDLTMTGDSYLEVEGNNSNNENYNSLGLSCYGNISVSDRATIKAKGNDIAVYGDTISVNGGKITASAPKGAGIFSGNTLSISNGAEIKTTGYYPTLRANGSISISDSIVTAESVFDVAIYSNDITIINSIVKATGDGYGIYASNSTSVSGSWIESSCDDTYESVTDSVLFCNKVGSVTGNPILPGDVTVASDMTLTIPENCTLTIPAGTTFTNRGSITVNGSIINNGTIDCTGHSGGTATCTQAPVCSVCQTVYGEKNLENHTGNVIYTYTETTHESHYDCCNTTVVAEEGHEWSNGVCTECLYECRHSGGTATCTQAAICQLCGKEYGGINPANHTGSVIYVRTETTHEAYYYCCNKVVVAEERHHWRNGVCSECDYVCVHFGGSATCTNGAVCEVCGEKYGEADPEKHTGTKVWTALNESKHEQKYSCCGKVTVESSDHTWVNGVCSECGYSCKHSGGTATCTEKATCEICGEKYGKVDSSNHTGTKMWTTQSETKHEQNYSCCGATAVPKEDHTWVNGVCSECGYTCRHTGGEATCTEKATCKFCGEKYGEVDAGNHTGSKVWTVQTESEHEQVYSCCGEVTVERQSHTWNSGVCADCGYTCEHSGGVATCSEQAICQYCGEKYGDKDSSNHASLKKISSVPATAASEGHIEYYSCADCGKLFKDATAGAEITVADTVTPKIPPVITEGKSKSWTKNSGKTLRFVSDADISDFIEVIVDGKTVDAKNYTKSGNGGIVIELNEAFLETLAEGQHTLTIRSASGDATTEFSVSAVQTFPTIIIIVIAAVIIIAIIVVIILVSRKKKS